MSLTIEELVIDTIGPTMGSVPAFAWATVRAKFSSGDDFENPHPEIKLMVPIAYSGDDKISEIQNRTWLASKALLGELAKIFDAHGPEGLRELSDQLEKVV